MGITTNTGSNIICFSNAADAVDRELVVNFLYWVGTAIADTDDLLVVDTLSNTIWEAVSTSADYHQYFPLKNKVQGLRVKTLDHGKVYAVLAGAGLHEYDF